MAEYVDRERLKEAFITDLQTLQTVDEHTLNLAILEIEEAPAADVVPVVHGRWGIDEFGKKCSECKEYIPDDFTPSAHCPHCGAKMDGGSNE